MKQNTLELPEIIINVLDTNPTNPISTANHWLDFIFEYQIL